MIITPLFPYICAVFLKIFGQEIIVLRVLECIGTASILFTTFKIMERLKMHKGVALIAVIFIYFIYKETFCFDYNWAVLFIQLILLYIELKSKDNLLECKTKTEFLLGILARNNNTIKTNNRNDFCNRFCIL